MRWRVGAAALGAVALARPAAGEEPKSLLGQKAASTGSTDVAAGGFEGAKKPEGSRDATELRIAAGGLFASGNSRSLAVTSATSFRLRRSENQLSASTAANFARSAAGSDEPMETTVENLQGRTRYDRFFAGNLAAFLAVSARHDRFQGLDLRLNVDPGLAYYFVDREKHQLWAELGYDLQYDVRRRDVVAGTGLERTATRHSARSFAGYENKVNASVSFTTGVEHLQSVQASRDWRLNVEAGLTSAIADRFAASTTFSLRYDAAPLPGVERLDTLTSFSLVYTLL